MANEIALAKAYTGILDEVYAKESVTTGLNSPAEIVRAGVNANEILVPKLGVTGLADYSRNDGYVKGSVSVSWETLKYEYDRGIRFEVDVMDDQETFNIAAGRAGGELVRTQGAPEGDAYTFAKIAGAEGITAEAAELADTEAAMKAIEAAMAAMDDASVPEETRILYATPAIIRGIQALDTYKSRELIEAFMDVVKVPQSRFYTQIELLNYDGDATGGYKKAAAGADINFMIVEKSAILKHDKHVVNHVIAPEYNNTGDGYIIKLRKYGIAEVFENKVAGVYVHHKPAA